MSSGKDIGNDLGIIHKLTKFVTSKKGMYILGTILLLCVVYYYTMCKKPSKTNNTEQIDQQEIPQPPPGYVTVPIDMIQELQNKELPQQIPLPQPQVPLPQLQVPLPQPQIQTPPQQIYEQQQPQQPAQDLNNEYNLQAPILKHNQQIEDDEEPEIVEQNLSKEEMESIQAQLSAMQQQRNTN